ELAQPVAEIVERRFPCHRLQHSVDAHHRLLDAIRVMVHLRKRPPLGAGVAVGQRVLRVAPHSHDLVAGDVHQDPADRRADPAEALDRPHLVLGHFYRPFHVGGRLSTKALAPSAASSLLNTRAMSSGCAQPRCGSTRAASRMSRLVTWTASGPLAATLDASSTAASISWSEGTTRLTSPTAWARAASMASPVSPSSNAMASGMRALSVVPPPAGKSPRLTSARPNLACSAATIRSHKRASSQPPATAGPLTAATTGFGKPPRWNHVKASNDVSSPSPDSRSSLKARRSMPAQNALSPAPVMTTARTPSSSAAPRNDSLRALIRAGLRALRASGLLRVRTSTNPTHSCRSSVTVTPASPRSGEGRPSYGSRA